jgi:o-succinylbenzoate synthase
MKYRFDYLPYRRKFRRPLATAHGIWEYREGIIIRVESDESGVGFGEIAPLPSFGTETFKQALQWCKDEAAASRGAISVPDHLRCCTWAMVSARGKWVGEKRTFPVAALVDSPDTFSARQASGYQTFKLKIGVGKVSDEIETISQYIRQLHPGQHLRLDANGALSEREYLQWLEFLEGQPIDFLEQPMKPGLEHRMLEMVEPFSSAVALDESIAGLESLVRWKHWPGPLVVKPSLLGMAKDLRTGNIIGSSVFETSFGLEAALQFLARHQKTDAAIGFDTISMVEADGWCIHQAGPALTGGLVTPVNLQQLWEAMQ